MLRKYWTIASMSWQRALTYRANTLLEVAGYLSTMTISIVLWRFAFQHAGQQQIGGYTMREMVLYLLAAGWLTSVFWFTAQGERIVREIKEGTMSTYLVKPMNSFFYHFFYINAGKFMQFMWGSFAFAVVVIVFRFHTYFVHTQFHLIMFMIFLVIAWLIQWLIFFTAALLAFWFEEVWGFSFLIRVFSDVAAGAFLPLALFSPFWQNIFNVLPFKYIVSVPVNVLLGHITPAAILPTFLGALIWLGTLILLAFITFRRGIRRYSAVGG